MIPTIPTAVLGGVENYVKGTIASRLAPYGLAVLWVYPMDKAPPRSIPDTCKVVLLLTDMQHDNVDALLSQAQRAGMKVVRSPRGKGPMLEALRLAGFAGVPTVPTLPAPPPPKPTTWFVAVPSASELKFFDAPDSIRADNVDDAFLLGSIHYGEDRHLSVLNSQGHLVATTKQKDNMNLTIQLTTAEGEKLDAELRRINILRSILGQPAEKREEFVARLLRAGLAQQSEQMEQFRKASSA